LPALELFAENATLYRKLLVPEHFDVEKSSRGSLVRQADQLGSTVVSPGNGQP